MKQLRNKRIRNNMHNQTHKQSSQQGPGGGMGGGGGYQGGGGGQQGYGGRGGGYQGGLDQIKMLKLVWYILIYAKSHYAKSQHIKCNDI